MSATDERVLASLDSQSLPPIIGQSQALREVVALARRVAPSDMPVLLVAPTGCGKELFAQYIHRWSGRAADLVDVNCAAIPDALLESELFGHAAGAFTGARRAKPGLLEVADRSSCFLDEISSLPLLLQAKLLRVMDTHEVRRVGELMKRRVDVRFIAAAQDDLAKRVEQGLFRPDLYQRLAGVVIRIPSLGERVEDVVPLARYFAERLHRSLDPSAESVLLEHRWRGNVRELRMSIERAALTEPSGPLGLRAVLPAIAHGLLDPTTPSVGGNGKQSTASMRGDPAALTDLLKQHKGRVAVAARAAELPRSTLRRWLEEVGLAGGRQRGRPVAEARENGRGHL